jgi:hypothetical protein
MSIFTNLETDFEGFWANHVKPFLTNDVEPILKGFIAQFDSQFGQQAITAALGAVATIPTAGFAATAVSLATTLYTDAKADAATDATLTATQVLQTVQSALQVAKASSNTVTAADTTAAAAIATPSA